MVNGTTINTIENSGPLLDVKDLVCSYEFNKKSLIKNRQSKNVVNGVSFEVMPGETFALVGESGSGKTTIIRAIGGLIKPVSGHVWYKNIDLTQPVSKRPKKLSRKIRVAFQNPDSSLNPKKRISYSVGRPLKQFLGLSGITLKKRIEAALKSVKLDSVYMNRFPGQISTGERQRVAIARALAADPELILCDEILSALDVSVQSNIIDLLLDLQKELSLTYLFVSHDLAVVRWLAHHIGVLYLGNMLETGTVAEVINPPYHPYTEVLLLAVPRLIPGFRTPELALVAGESRKSNLEGCPFEPRCPRKIGAICKSIKPPWQVSETGHRIACHISREKLLTVQTNIFETQKKRGQ